MKIGVVYPRVSHYREEFFEGLMGCHDLDIYIYESEESSVNNNFKNSKMPTKKLKSFDLFGKLRVLDIFTVIRENYDVIILIGEMRNISVWFMLLYYKFKKTKVVLWGHGISVHSYLKEEKALNPFRVIFHRLADLNWYYTSKEVSIWDKYLKTGSSVSLNNTIFIEEILDREVSSKIALKKTYKIEQEIVFIFSARFNNPHRRVDLLLDLIDKLDVTKYGFIIIGDGRLKPDFSKYCNVYDFGAVYERTKKNDLFDMADLYFQPAWMGLSCTEALAYGKPVITFERSDLIRQCVEYAYLDDANSYRASDVEDLLKFIENLSLDELRSMSVAARSYAIRNLRMSCMVDNALESLELS